MRRTTSYIIVTIYLGALLPACLASASMMRHTQFILDLTKPNEFVEKAAWQSPSKNVRLTEKGLTLNAAPEASADVWIQTTEPIAVGWSWRPVQSVYIRAQADPPGKFAFYKSQVTFPSGALYARYSPDALHWSDWQYLKMEKPKDQNEPKQMYSGSLRVPRRQRQRYQELLMTYLKMDVPWVSDEEAAVKWILENDPNFFEKPAPFIGYVQFLYEISLKGGHPIKTLTFDMSYGTSGMHAPLKDQDLFRSRHGRWRFKAAELQENKGPDRATTQ
jgi:hypothetical protein